jgi:hypothetical protein
VGKDANRAHITGTLATEQDQNTMTEKPVKSAVWMILRLPGTGVKGKPLVKDNS